MGVRVSTSTASSFSIISLGTAGFTGADLENLINEGALLAARKNQHFLTMQDLKDAEIKVISCGGRNYVLTEKI